MISIPILNLLSRMNVWLIRICFLFAVFFFVKEFIYLENKKKFIAIAIAVFACLGLLLIPRFNLLYNDEFHYNSMAFSIKDFGIYYSYHESAEVFGPSAKCAVFPYLIYLSYYFTNGSPYSSIYVNMILYSLSALLILILFFELFKDRLKRKKSVFLYSLLFVVIFLSVYYLKSLSRNGETHPTSIFFVLLFILAFIKFLKSNLLKDFFMVIPIGIIASISRPENLFIVIALFLFALALINKNKSKANKFEGYNSNIEQRNKTFKEKFKSMLDKIKSNKKLSILIVAIIIGIFCIPNFLIIYKEYFLKSWAQEKGNFSLLYFYDNLKFMSGYFSNTSEYWFFGLLIYAFFISVGIVLMKMLNVFFKNQRIRHLNQKIEEIDENNIFLFCCCTFLSAVFSIFISFVSQNRAPRVYSILFVLAIVWMAVFFWFAYKIKRIRKLLVLFVVLFVFLSVINGLRLVTADVKYYINYDRAKQLEFINEIFLYTKDIQGEYYVVTQYPEALAFLKEKVIDTDDFLAHVDFYKEKELYIYFKNLYFTHSTIPLEPLIIQPKMIYRIYEKDDEYFITDVLSKKNFLLGVGEYTFYFEKVTRK